MAATVDIAVTAAPRALEDEASFVDGTRYTVSNDSERLILYRVSVAEPVAGALGHAVPPYRDIELVFSTPVSGEKTWVWCRDPPAHLVITETAE